MIVVFEVWKNSGAQANFTFEEGQILSYSVKLFLNDLPGKSRYLPLFIGHLYLLRVGLLRCFYGLIVISLFYIMCNNKKNLLLKTWFKKNKLIFFLYEWMKRENHRTSIQCNYMGDAHV